MAKTDRWRHESGVAVTTFSIGCYDFASTVPRTSVTSGKNHHKARKQNMTTDEKRKRRAKRKAKQARKERTRLPRFIACHYLKNMIPPDGEILRDAFDCARDRSRWVQL